MIDPEIDDDPIFTLGLIFSYSEALLLDPAFATFINAFSVFRNGRLQPYRPRRVLIAVEPQSGRLRATFTLVDSRIGYEPEVDHARIAISAWDLIRGMKAEEILRRYRPSKAQGTLLALDPDGELFQRSIWAKLGLDPYLILVPNKQQERFEEWLNQQCAHDGARALIATYRSAEA